MGMRSKAPLLLMEQMVMLLVFALAAALCLQAFVKSDGLSGDSEDRDRAVILCQNAAETIRRFGGDAVSGDAARALGYHYDNGVMYQEFDEDWEPVDSGVYRLETEERPTEVPGLASAYVRVKKARPGDGEPEVLFALETAWQKEAARLG